MVAGAAARARSREWGGLGVIVLAVLCVEVITIIADILQGVFKGNNVAWTSPDSGSLILSKVASRVRILVEDVGLVVGGRSHLVAGPSHHAGTACVIRAEIVNFRCFSVMAGGTGCLALEGARGTPPVRLSGALCSSSCIDCGGSGTPQYF